MAAAKIKKGDQVIVLSGKDKGKTGTVTASMPKEQKVIVGGVNVATKHRKPSQANPQGGLERIEAPLHVSKVAHVTADGKPTVFAPPGAPPVAVPQPQPMAKEGQPSWGVFNK